MPFPFGMGIGRLAGPSIGDTSGDEGVPFSIMIPGGCINVGTGGVSVGNTATLSSSSLLDLRRCIREGCSVEIPFTAMMRACNVPLFLLSVLGITIGLQIGAISTGPAVASTLEFSSRSMKRVSAV